MRDETKVHSSVRKPAQRLRDLALCAGAQRLVRALLVHQQGDVCSQHAVSCGVGAWQTVHGRMVLEAEPCFPFSLLYVWLRTRDMWRGVGLFVSGIPSHLSQPQACTKLGGLMSKEPPKGLCEPSSKTLLKVWFLREMANQKGMMFHRYERWAKDTISWRRRSGARAGAW